MKKVHLDVSEQTHDFLQKNFVHIRDGSIYILEAFPTLYKDALSGLKGMFEDKELYLMIDVLNSTFLTPALAGQHLSACVEDGIDLDRLDEKWEVEKDSITLKFEGLGRFSLACLEIWLKAFWAQNDRKDPATLKEYVKDLAK